jgi:hypothetical protein
MINDIYNSSISTYYQHIPHGSYDVQFWTINMGACLFGYLFGRLLCRFAFWIATGDISHLELFSDADTK